MLTSKQYFSSMLIHSSHTHTTYREIYLPLSGHRMRGDLCEARPQNCMYCSNIFRLHFDRLVRRTSKIGIFSWDRQNQVWIFLCSTSKLHGLLNIWAQTCCHHFCKTSETGILLTFDHTLGQKCYANWSKLHVLFNISVLVRFDIWSLL